MSKQNPRGIRNANPGNIELRDPWQGLAPQNQQTDGRFAVFTKPVWGIRAIARTLITYQDKYHVNSVRQAISRWAPPSENNTQAYINQVANLVDASPDAKLDFQNYRILRPMVEAIIRHENGPGPLKTANTWYDDATIDEALRLAGIVPTKPKAVLATTEGKAAGAAVATGGVAAVAELVNQAAPLLGEVKRSAQDTEGMPGWIRTVIVGLTLVSVAAAAYVLWTKHKARKAL
ncbi:hypothetical protein [Bordetella genomosp. 4]|uniref:hypothetical protein n=1 Tax=Bordetella genomosp. 4 TaxID=463044 RepID=UPI0015C58B28|nr:hypothetical protein [Bordetella genomosp. 4]